MTNPFEPPNTSTPQSMGVRRPWLICLLVTFAALFGWLGLLGAQIFGWLGLIGLMVIPLINALVVAPWLAQVVCNSTPRAVALHLAVGLPILAGPFYWPSIVRMVSSLRWTMQPAYMIVMWVPPVLVGSLIYSIAWIRRSSTK